MTAGKKHAKKRSTPSTEQIVAYVVGQGERLSTVNEIAEHFECLPSTFLRYRLNLAVASGHLSRVPAYHPTGHLGWGYISRAVQPTLFGEGSYEHGS